MGQRSHIECTIELGGRIVLLTHNRRLNGLLWCPLFQIFLDGITISSFNPWGDGFVYSRYQFYNHLLGCPNECSLWGSLVLKLGDGIIVGPTVLIRFVPESGICQIQHKEGSERIPPYTPTHPLSFPDYTMDSWLPWGFCCTYVATSEALRRRQSPMDNS